MTTHPEEKPPSSKEKYSEGTNFVEAGIEANTALFTLIILAPFLSLLFAFLTSPEMESQYPGMATSPFTMATHCWRDMKSCGSNVWNAGVSVTPNGEAMRFIGGFTGVALLLERMLPGSIEYGPETATGHIPAYVDNGLRHCIVFTLLFITGSNFGVNFYDFGIFYDTFTGSVAFLNIFGMIFCAGLTMKGLYYPSTQDCGSSGSIFKDYLWGTELYPRIFGIDLKRFVNCRFTFTGSVAFLNIFGMIFCAGLTMKGLYYPSTQDCGSSGSIFKDYLWGTELYPRIFGIDLKRFVNCRFSMTYWQLAGLSYCYRSYTLHDNTIDWGLFFSALSQYLYLVKFFLWEMGYMRSIDIIVDRAGFEIQWGCLVWVPSVYSLHTRFCVQNPTHLSFSTAFALFLLSMAGVVLNYLADRERDSSVPPFEIQWGCLVWVPSVYSLHTRFCVQNPTHLSFTTAGALFLLSMAGVVLNYLADRERDIFRATNGKTPVWGKPPKYITAEYETTDRTTGITSTKKSLLLASGFWGMARHFQYFFELTAAWSWCALANPVVNGVLPLFYACFLTYLLIDRAERDSKKCHAKYGVYYEEYCKLVPYKIVPGLY
eukprot:CAMPEP_0194395268 /NCGR_PEP_ID=MMETSP0174-20130528/124328_1 /TAXON_ID=216777 /ORGANISM="Proboscia alata, Strain PI-D3" /LENGTH=599 /DNA_ID=CAMNT_0039191183 /DNA_START=65 /DNA_END=1865 /DNA_ORIENTATION=-